jgi:TPR repeat protein
MLKEMRMRRAYAIAVVTGVAFGVAVLLHAQTPRSAEVQMKAAQHKAEVEGDLKGAIDLYRRISQSGDRALAATALVRMAECYQKLGDEQAHRIFEQVVREYGDQKDAVEIARAHLGPVAAARGDQTVWSGAPQRRCVAASRGYECAAAVQRNLEEEEFVACTADIPGSGTSGSQLKSG